MRVLVTGGAGYIGSHTVVQLIEAGHDVVIADNFSNASRAVVPRLEAIVGRTLDVREVDVTSPVAVASLFGGPAIDAVIHFAGFKAVAESVEQPLRYYRNNLDSTLTLLEAMDAADVRTLVFSSSAVVYGPDAQSPVTEDLPTHSINPYGWTKVMLEQILKDVAVSDPRWRIALLRYFNPAGAHPSGTIGEDPGGVPSNLVPFIAQVASGRRDRLLVFGDDYDTVDGTGVRDFIHVDDLAAGHLAALTRLADPATHGPLHVWNLGTGRGTSVLEMLAAFSRAVGQTLPHEVVGRRPGDMGASWADPSRAEAELGWRATRGIDDMTRDHWRWESQNPTGYPSA